MIAKKNSSYIISILGLIMFAQVLSVEAMTITPVRYELSANPGENISKDITIINEEEVGVTYYSSFANFEAQGETGSASFVDPIDDIGTWMQTEKSVTLLPGEQRTVSFTISVPENAEPGGHFGVIFWGTSPENSADGKQLAVSAKTGLLVLLSVSGDVKEEGGLLDFIKKDNKFWYNSLPVSFTYRFKNDGGDRIKPKGWIKISNTFFIPVKKLDANPVNGNILPNSTRKFTVDWVKYVEPKDKIAPTGVVKQFFDRAIYQWKNFAFGLYGAKLDMTYGLQEQQVERKVFFFVFPWQLLICLILIFLIVFFTGKKLIGRYNKYIIQKAHSTVKIPDDGNHG